MKASKKKSCGNEKKMGSVKVKPAKKHLCPDCNFCQLCNDEKCAICRPSIRKKCDKKKKKEHKPLFLRY